MKRFKLEFAHFESEPGIKIIRETVFIKEQNVPVELEWEDEDYSAIHIIARDNNDKVIATARLLNNGHIGRMAVLKPFRHQSIGSEMLNKLLEKSKSLGLSRVFLNAQSTAVEFYKRAGFEVQGEEFMDAGIPHYRMDKSL
jgi:predicted GNAT family N-acyltransferase